jgi:hypothetical protein
MSDNLSTQLTVTAPELMEAEDKHGPHKNEHGEPIPPGNYLTDALQSGLSAAGWKCEFRWATFNSHAFDAQRGDHRYDVEVTLVDPASARYTVTAKPRVGFFKRVFSSGKPDPNEHALLRLAIDQVLAGDARITVTGGWPDPEA